MKTLKRIFLMLLFAVMSVVIAQAQTLTPPEIDWKRVDWAPIHPDNGLQGQDESGEDWWYDHKNSYDANDKLNGYIVCGYSTFVNYQIDEDAYNGCLQLTVPSGPVCNNQFECEDYYKCDAVSTMALISADGKNRSWFRVFVSGELFRVIQTSDGGYLAVGGTGSTRTMEGDIIYYNPNGSNSYYFEDGDNCTTGPNPFSSHAYVVKVDANGEIEWQYIYGMYDFATDDQIAYQRSATAQDVAELPNGNLIIVGGADDGTTRVSFMMEINSDGELVNQTWIEGNDGYNMARTLVIYQEPTDVKIVIAGHKDFTSGNVTKIFIEKYNYTTSTWEWGPEYYYQTTFSNRRSVPWDVDISHDFDKIFLAGVVQCDNCGGGPDNSGLCRVYVLEPSDGTLISNSISNQIIDFGDVHAFDLKVGIVPTADNGFGLVSSKIVNDYNDWGFTPYCCYNAPGEDVILPEPYWNSDAYVAKADFEGVIQWQKTFDEDDDGPAQFPEDVKKQECLYSISQAEDGGFVISGNYSSNFDDNYLVKLYGDCQPNVGYDLADYSVPSGTTTWSGVSYIIQGSIIIN